MNTHITRLGLAGLLVLGLAVPAAPAVATPAAQGVPVRFADLNVESRTGAAVHSGHTGAPKQDETRG